MKYTPALLTALAAASVVHAQPELACNGFDNVVYAGDQVQDYLVPNIADVTVFFTVQGADGGRAILDALFDDNDQDWPGGEGAQAVIGVRIGNDPGQIAPGGTIRFIVGKKGDDVSEDTSFGADVAAAGGGGGSAVLYLPPNGTWANNGVILAAAGGGGGACAADLSGRGPGFDANEGECGDDLVDGTDVSMGGCNGLGGQGRFGGGGAGAFGNGGPGGFNPGFQGKLGFPSGGAGGTSNAGNGGWGFGGGGAGGGTGAGGGGGYSGGAAACCSSIDDPDGPAGGGGSYINQAYATPGSGTLGGFSPRDDNGFAQYVIDRFIPNNQQFFPDPVFDNAPVSGSFCGAQDSGVWDCGPNIDGADLWYTYTSPIDCAPADITISVTAGDAEIQAYFPGADLNNPSSCRGTSTNGVYIDTLNPGESILFRVQSPTGTDFTMVASSDFASGLPDCDGNGIPDACDIAANPGLDCNGNGRPDSCDIADGISQDCDSDGIPDECDPSDDCPPPNDDQVNALPITDGTYFYDTEFGTLDGTASCTGGGLVDIWYEYTAPADGQLVACQDVNSAFGNILSTSIFDQMGNELACGDRDSTGIFDTRVVYTMAAGETVLIRVEGTGQNIGFALTEGDVIVEFDVGLTNDRCENALPVVLDGGPYPFNLANVEDSAFDAPACASVSDNQDVWYSYTSAAGGLTRFRIDARAAIALYDACGGTELDCERWTSVVGGFDPPAIDRSMAPGETVLVRVIERGSLVEGNFFVEDVTTCGVADLDMDGDLDFFDVSAFLNAFNAMDPVADFTKDGVFNFFDVSAFLNAYNAGCP